MELQIKELSKSYSNGVKALDNVSLTVGKGMFGLLGQNGAGKSTLMRTIATLQDADCGTIRMGDIDVLRSPGELRKKLGYLPQEFGVYPNLSSYEMLHQLADLKGIVNKQEREELVMYLLKKTNLYDVRDKKLGTYSGGMKQRFGIAQALIGNPSLIIVDEPTAGLDPTERNRFYNLLSEIGENTIVILSTHIVEDVSTLCNNMAIIDKGKVVMQGAPERIQHSLEGNLWQKQIDKRELETYTKSYNVIASHFYAGKMHITVIADNNPGDGFTPKHPTLEDVYFKCNNTTIKEQA
jgi:ABC-type multidrug transport system ATPase subunit